MRLYFSILVFFTFTSLASGKREAIVVAENNMRGSVPAERPIDFLGEELKRLMVEKKAARFNLGLSQNGRPIEAYFFPGRSNRNALVIGGVHGSELSSIEVTRALIGQLSAADSIYYNVIVIPCLFPDNAEKAIRYSTEIGTPKNIGRYTFPGATDPNRQMPTPGSDIHDGECIDHAGREVESENLMLLQLIREYKPARIASVHAIRNTDFAGFFADPRTDEQGIALGYATDSTLSVSMAAYASREGGYVPGNKLHSTPTALYYKDPVPAAKGKFQKRNFKGSSTPGYRGSGISLGTWGATAVRDPHNPSYNRDAMRIITIEFPGSKRPADYATTTQQARCRRQVKAVAGAILNIFLQENCIEENTAGL